MRWESLEDYLASCSTSFDLAERAVRDVEFDWFACDSKRNIAMLTTGAQLLAPRVVFRDKKRYLSTCATFYQTPERGEGMLKRSGKFDFEEWLIASRRGFYAYDWNDDPQFNDTYAIVAVPTSPIFVDELGSAAVDLVHFAGDFACAPMVTLADFA